MNSNQELKAVCDEYAIELPKKIAAISSTWNHLKETSNTALLKELIRKVHSLIGSGATFGFSELSLAAAKLEKALRKHQQQNQSSTFSPEYFEQLFLTLENAAQQPPEYDFSADKPQPLKTANNIENDVPCVLLISDNEGVTSDLNARLNTYDIQTHILGTSTDLLSCIEKTNPYCILIEISSVQNRAIEMDAIKTIRQGLSQPPALIVISEKDDMATRLSAVRAGALAYFIKPVYMHEMVTVILSQCKKELEPPYRILLIDDDVQFAHHIALLLERAGMETQIVTKPMTILERLASFKPELILLDLHMPECSGLELAAIIRQQCLYTGISIVFFSAETDIEQLIDALRAGGIDFFVKGLPPKQLIAKVEAKAKYARAVQNLMLNDALTGLSNRTHFTQIMSKLLASSQRHQRCFSYVMLDLDHFKLINDQFGHQAGDEVLRSISSIIMQRLRSIDTAIRYGGEEIVILLPDTNAEQACVITNELLNKFSDITFIANNQSFSVTFSAGIAEYPFCPDLSSLAEAADKALYKAKTEGRNQVYLSKKSGA